MKEARNEIKVSDRKRIAQIYLEKNIIAHIIYSSDDGSKRWRNGKILEVNDDHLMLKEHYEGTMPILFSNIVAITPFMPKKEEVSS